jgi:hypothetical protein
MLLEDVKAALVKLTEWLSVPLKDYLDPDVAEEEDVGAEAKKKAAAAPGKKDDIDVPLPQSGIQTLTLCIDHRLAELPWESLPLFNVVPIISRDFSPYNFDYRLAHIG